MIKLSILVPSLKARTEFRLRLLNILSPQIGRDDVELDFSIDNGEISTGAKRNLMVENARGEYIVFVDDDDRVADDYVDRMFDGINKNVDAVCVQQIITFDGVNPKRVIDSPYQANDFRNNVYYRGVQHLDAVKKELAVQIKYPDVYFGEDAEWTKRMHESKLIKTWHNIGKPVYFYESRSKK